MTNRIIDTAEEIYCISRKLEAYSDLLRTAQYLLQENNARCAAIGYHDADSRAAKLEEIIREYLYLHQKLSKMLEECSAQYLHEIQPALLPTEPIRYDP